jgi:hypothetical protein
MSDKCSCSEEQLPSCSTEHTVGAADRATLSRELGDA